MNTNYGGWKRSRFGPENVSVDCPCALKLKVRLQASKIEKLIMNAPPILGKVAVLILASAIAAKASDSFSDADKAFVAKVSQGGMYEVELGKLAQNKRGHSGYQRSGQY